MADPADDNMTDDEFAATPFEPWQHKPDEWKPPSTKEWTELANPHLANIKIAWHAMFRSKDEMIETARSLVASGIFIDTIENLDGTKMWLSALLKIIEGGQARLIVAGMNVEGVEEAAQ